MKEVKGKNWAIVELNVEKDDDVFTLIYSQDDHKFYAEHEFKHYFYMYN